MASGPITSWQIDGETVETAADFIFLGSKITANGDCRHDIKRCLRELSRTLGERQRSGGCPSCAQQPAPSRSPTRASALSPAVENGEKNHLL